LPTNPDRINRRDSITSGSTRFANASTNWRLFFFATAASASKSAARTQAGFSANT
jgi:hypothetical protein